MENNKFKSVLQERVNKDKEDAKKDAELRKQYGIENGRTVGIKIQKQSIVMAIWKILCDIFRLVLKFLLIGLVLIGFMSVVHPDLREILVIILKNSLEQIKAFAPFLPIRV
ncbi:hypothetical protein [Lacrimispora amygdalina]|uniref:hypothetical protein n=1 Tax=Lacrimispora amygdalina TaxID=253257 RepID=UPI000BE2F9BC|nr:hypothetical protein [Lacrimispora amygdalina]